MSQVERSDPTAEGGGGAARAEIVVDLDAIADNVATLRRTVRERAAGALMMTVVKADGYGHGFVESARARVPVARTGSGSRCSRRPSPCARRATPGPCSRGWRCPGRTTSARTRRRRPHGIHPRPGRGGGRGRALGRTTSPAAPEGGHRAEPGGRHRGGLAGARRGGSRRRADRRRAGDRHLVALRVQPRARPPLERPAGAGVRPGAQGRRRRRHRARGAPPLELRGCAAAAVVGPTTWCGAASRHTASRPPRTSSPLATSGSCRR